ncbi:MAG: hypothetical protein PVI30_12425 [Myxococcales bacterium]
MELQTDYADSAENFSDGLPDEDNWKTNIPRRARGIFVHDVYRYTAGFPTVVPDGFTGDGLGSGDPGKGCTPWFSTSPGWHHVGILSVGAVNGNYVVATRNGSFVDAGGWIYVSSSGTKVMAFDSELTLANVFNEFHVYSAGAYSIYRHAGGLTGEIFHYAVGPGTGYNSKDQIIKISDNRSDEKFVISHETGHAIIQRFANGLANTGRDSAPVGSCPSEPATEGHSMRSQEYSAKAFYEGFANFYAADVWNDDDENDCTLAYWKDVSGSKRRVDCRDGAGDPLFPKAYLDTQCGGGAGLGTELDWMRVFWNVHTTGSRPSFDSMVNWIGDAIIEADAGGDWGDATAYDVLDAAASGDIGDNWDVAAPAHGIDH